MEITMKSNKLGLCPIFTLQYLKIYKHPKHESAIALSSPQILQILQI